MEVVKVVYRDELWHGLIVDSKHPGGAVVATSRDAEAVVTWARQYAGAKGIEVHVFDEMGELREVYSQNRRS